MFERIFTKKQLSFLFNSAVVLNIIVLIFHIIVYRYFPHAQVIKTVIKNISNLSIFIVCLIIVSQAILIFAEQHKTLHEDYKLVALIIEAILCIMFLWLLNINSNIETKFIIFCSTTWRQGNKKIIIVIAAFMALMFYNFYKMIIKKSNSVTNHSVPQILHSTVNSVMRKYFLIILSVLGIFNFARLHTFSLSILRYTLDSLFFDFGLFKISLFVLVIGGILYYLHKRKFKL